MTAGERKPEWFDEEAFWVECWPFLFSEERLSEAREEVDKLLNLIPDSGERVLDLCCGPGRHSIELARRGKRVTAVDRTVFLLERARERAAEAQVEVEWVLSDMRDFQRPECFGLALSMFSSFGYFEDKDEDVQLLRTIRRNLRPGGILLMDLAGKEGIAANYATTMADELPGGGVLVRRHEVIEDWTRVRNEWIVVRDGKARSFRFVLTLYSGQELRDRLLQAGFDSVRLFGDLAGNPYGPEAARLIVVASKASADG